jgi:hypothetical protein
VADAKLKFERVETGRTHTTRDGVVPIADEGGVAEAVYQLNAYVDGVPVTLMTKQASYIDSLIQRAKETADDGEPAEGANVPSDES